MLKTIKKNIQKIQIINKLLETYGANRLRTRVSTKYIKGKGLEIGALHNPLFYSKTSATVLYVDRVPVDVLRKHYPELNAEKLVEIDIVDDGEELHTISSNSLDFIIANHMLEHCKNPIQTIFTHINKIKSGGILYYAVPLMKYTRDRRRSLTTFEHLVDDYFKKNDDFQHYTEWSRFWYNGLNESEVTKQANHLFEISYSIHFHTWTLDSFLEFLMKINNFNSSTPLFSIDFFSRNKYEAIAVLRKNEPDPI